jgi:hypothetical protein
MFLNDLFHGKGQYISGNKKIIYEGQFVNNKFHGEGTLQRIGEHIYKGNFVQEKYEGQG